MVKSSIYKSNVPIGHMHITISSRSITIAIFIYLYHMTLPLYGISELSFCCYNYSSRFKIHLYMNMYNFLMDKSTESEMFPSLTLNLSLFLFVLLFKSQLFRKELLITLESYLFPCLDFLKKKKIAETWISSDEKFVTVLVIHVQDCTKLFDISWTFETHKKLQSTRSCNWILCNLRVRDNYQMLLIMSCTLIVRSSVRFVFWVLVCVDFFFYWNWTSLSVNLFCIVYTK